MHRTVLGVPVSHKTPLLLRSAQLSPSQTAVLLDLWSRLDASPPNVAVGAGGSDLSRSTGLLRQTVASALASLLRAGVLRCHVPPIGNSPGYYSIEDDPLRWRCGFRVKQPSLLGWSPDSGPVAAEGAPLMAGRRATVSVGGGR